MPRVNVEDDVWTDARFKLLARLIGVDDFGMVGRMVAIWNHCTDDETDVLTPDALFGLTAVVDMDKHLVRAGLGEVVAGGIRVKGAHERCSWLKKKRDAGRNGGMVTASLGTATKNLKQNGSTPEAKPKRRRSKTEASTEAPPSPLVSGLSALVSGLSAPEEIAAAPLVLEPAGPSEVTRFKAGWLEVFLAATGSEASWGAAQAGQAAQLVKRGKGSADEAIARAAFLFSPDCPPWIAKGGRDLGTLVQHWDKLASARASPTAGGHYKHTGNETYADGEVKL